MKHLKTIALFVSLFFMSCNMRDDDIKNDMWKYCGGTRLNELDDFVEFTNTNYGLKNDTIFKNDKPVAKIIETKISLFGSGSKIIVESFLTKKQSTYCGK